MKTQLNLFNYPHRSNPTANTPLISGGGTSRHSIPKILTLTLLLLTLAVGDVWGNYVYFYPASDGDNNWYADDAAFTVSFSDPSVDICDYEEVNGSGTGVWRFNISERTGTAYFKRRNKDACNGNWNQVSGTVDASHNVMYASTKSSGTMQSYVINYIHNTNQIYFDNTNSNFSGNIYFVIGHDVKPNGTADTYSIAYPMTRVIGTNLYRAVISATWQDANFYGIIASTSDESTVNGDHKWGSSSLSSKGTSGYTAAYKYVFNMEGGVYICSTSASGNNQALTFSYCGTEHTSLPKHNASQAAKKRDTGTTYTDVSGSWPATLKLRGSYMNTSSDTARNTITSTASTDTEEGYRKYAAIQSGTITQSYTGLDANYYFEGWGTGSTPTNKEATNEYHISESTTVYAFFSKLYTLTYDRKGDYSTSTLSVFSVADFSGETSSGSSIPTGHLITLVATPATGYEVEGWYKDASCETAYTNGSDNVTIEGGGNTFKLATLNANTEVYCNFRPKNYTINLENMEATTPGTTSVDVTYNASTNMTASDPITKPTKTNYDFGGYWVRNEDTKALVTKLIDEDGKWIKDKEGYTSHDGSDNPTWVHDYAISLYAKWTETSYTITPSVSPAGAGSVNTVTDAHLVTPSSDITATPTNTVWVFDHWTCGTNVGIAGGKGTGDNPVTVTASQNSTITAYFKHRYNLLGSKYESDKEKASMATGGMPGWTYGSGADFTINSYTADGDNATVDLSYTCTLEAGTYIFEIHDRQKGESLGRTGDGGGIYALTDGSSVQLRGGTDIDQSIFFYPQHAGQYTFRITYMTKNGNYYYPTVTIERPHQVYFGTGYAGIDNLSSVTSGTTGGTLAVTTSAGSLSNEDWVTYGTDVTYTPSAATGYTFEGFYTSDEYSSRFTQDNPWIHYNVTSDDNVYAKFEEKATTVTLSNDGHGKVQINTTDKTGTTCGVTTTRELTAVPNEGYIFSSWNKSGDDIEITNTSTNPTTLTGNGAGAASGQTVTANFNYRYSIKGTMNGENWDADHLIANIGTNAGSKDTGYVEITLPANTTYEFAIYDKKNGVANPWLKNGTDEVHNMTYTNHTNWSFGTDKTYNCGITTAGKGTYKFIFNITDKTVTVIYPTSYQVNYGASVGGSVTSVKDDDNNDVPNGGYVRSGGNVTYTATPNDGYTFVGWCNDDSYGEPFTTYNPWPNNSVTATSNAYAKFKSTNFVIYRTGDMEEDDRAALDDVESYNGGLISEAIEFRMKVRTINQWYTLCLPFTVSAVKVWDDEDKQYYDIVPYYRSGDKFYSGHYVIRKPETSIGLAIENFDNWVDPENSSVKPTQNTPYIIQWAHNYFENKYVSFFGGTGQTIPGSMTVGDAPSTNTVVNVYGNNSMTTGSVQGAYMLEPDYGEGGAWLRLEDASTPRTINPFECFIRASSEVTAQFLVIRRGMKIEETATGWQDILNSETKSHIAVYTLSGVLMAQYENCSFAEVARRLRAEQHNGLFILRAENESVKLMIGGK